MIRPQSVDRYRKKELLSPFFPLSSSWSRYYVLVFKLPFELLMGNVLNWADKLEESEKNNSEANRLAVESISSIKTIASFSAENKKWKEYHHHYFAYHY